MEHGFIYMGIGIAVVIIGTFLIFQLESNQPEQVTYTNPMNVTYVIGNLDSLYGKPITVSGFWYDTAPFVDLHCGPSNPNKPIYDNSTYAVDPYGGINYLTNTTPLIGDLLLVNLPNNEYLFKDQDPVKHRGEFVTVNGILERYYYQCGDYYKSAILQVNSQLN
jgi:hypothetical protein